MSPVKFSDLYRKWPVDSIFKKEVFFKGDPFGRTYNTYTFPLEELQNLDYTITEGVFVWFLKGSYGFNFLYAVSEEHANETKIKMEESNE